MLSKYCIWSCRYFYTTWTIQLFMKIVYLPYQAKLLVSRGSRNLHQVKKRQLKHKRIEEHHKQSPSANQEAKYQQIQMQGNASFPIFNLYFHMARIEPKDQKQKHRIQSEWLHKSYNSAELHILQDSLHQIFSKLNQPTTKSEYYDIAISGRNQRLVTSIKILILGKGYPQTPKDV